MKKCAILWIALLLSCSFSFAQNFDIYVSDAGNFNNPPWKILKFDHEGKNPSTFINSQLNWPQDILFLEDSGTVLISNLGTNKITRHNAATGAYINDFARLISGPTRIKIGADGLLYVLQWSGNGLVLQYRLDGSYVGNFTTVGVPQSIGMDWDSEGNLYVSSYQDDLVRKFDTVGRDLGIFINSNLAGPTNIWFDTNGDLLVVDYDGTAVKRFGSNGQYKGDFMTGLRRAEGVAIYPNGDILIGNGASKSVKLYNSSGTYQRDMITASSGGLLTPNAVVLRERLSTSLEGPSSDLGVTMYPNPSEGSFMLSLKQVPPQGVDLQILNTLGQSIFESAIRQNNVQISLDRTPPGLYLLQVTARESQKTKTLKMLVK